jgi:hypothetical protein
MQTFIARRRTPLALPRQTLLVAAVLAGALAASQASAQTSANASATASVSIGNALAVTRNTDLSFGRVVINDPTTPASVAVGTASSVTSISNATEEGTGNVGSATFVVSGIGGQTYSVTFPQASINLGAGTNPPTVDSFSSTPSGADGQLSGTSASIGTQNLAVGGVLHVPARTAAGTYTGTFQVGVAYN